MNFTLTDIIILLIILIIAIIGGARGFIKAVFGKLCWILGILGARIGFPIADPIASIVIFLFIVKASVEIFEDAMDKLVDHSCDEATENALRDCILSHPDVLGIDLIQTRIFGNKIYVDLEISLDASLSLKEAHNIAENVHSEIETTFPKVKHIMIHVNPKE